MPPPIPAHTFLHPQCATPGDIAQPGHQKGLSQGEIKSGVVSPFSCLSCLPSSLPAEAAAAPVSERTYSQQLFLQQNLGVMVNWCELKEGKYFKQLQFATFWFVTYD